MKKIIIGTRGSKLALLYAEKAKEALLDNSSLAINDIEIKKIVTKGDQVVDYQKLVARDYFQKI